MGRGNAAPALFEQAGDGPAGREPGLPERRRRSSGPLEHIQGLRATRGNEGFEWVTSHVFRKTAPTVLDDAGLTARLIADQLGHSWPSMTQDVYIARKVVDAATARALEAMLGAPSDEVDPDDEEDPPDAVLCG